MRKISGRSRDSAKRKVKRQQPGVVGQFARPISDHFRVADHPEVARPVNTRAFIAINSHNLFDRCRDSLA
jgi:hypothetical protein